MDSLPKLGGMHWILQDYCEFHNDSLRSGRGGKVRVRKGQSRNLSRVEKNGGGGRSEVDERTEPRESWVSHRFELHQRAVSTVDSHTQGTLGTPLAQHNSQGLLHRNPASIFQANAAPCDLLTNHNVSDHQLVRPSGRELNSMARLANWCDKCSLTKKIVHFLVLCHQVPQSLC